MPKIFRFSLKEITYSFTAEFTPPHQEVDHV
jgi:hypothetical protein